MCHRKINPKAQKYQPTLEMCDILHKMAHIMREDPKGRKYVLMIEHPERLKGDKIDIGMSMGIKQNHKMRLLGLISYVSPEGTPCDGASKHIRGAYTITQRGRDLLLGLPISPWQIHVRNKRIVKMLEDENTRGSISDVRNFSHDEWREKLETIDTFLKLPG